MQIIVMFVEYLVLRLLVSVGLNLKILLDLLPDLTNTVKLLQDYSRLDLAMLKLERSLQDLKLATLSRGYFVWLKIKQSLTGEFIYVYAYLSSSSVHCLLICWVAHRYGFNSVGHEEFLKNLEVVLQNPGNHIIGVSIGKNKDSEDAIQDYVEGVKKFGCLADYIAINVSSPNTPGLRSLQEEKPLDELIKIVRCSFYGYTIFQLQFQIYLYLCFIIIGNVNKRQFKLHEESFSLR